jgi:hypothetical protein
MSCPLLSEEGTACHEHSTSTTKRLRVEHKLEVPTAAKLAELGHQPTQDASLTERATTKDAAPTTISVPT